MYQGCHLVKAAGMARGKDKNQAGEIIFQLAESGKDDLFLTLVRAAGDKNRLLWFQVKVAAELLRKLTGYLRQRLST